MGIIRLYTRNMANQTVASRTAKCLCGGLHPNACKSNSGNILATASFGLHVCMNNNGKYIKCSAVFNTYNIHEQITLNNKHGMRLYEQQLYDNTLIIRAAHNITIYSLGKPYPKIVIWAILIILIFLYDYYTKIKDNGNLRDITHNYFLRKMVTFSKIRQNVAAVT